MISRWVYLIREGFRSITTHAFMSFASVTIIMACLIIMGIVSLLSVNVDLSPVDYLEPIDICAIFGNVIDNAVEASEKITNPADRFVELKSGRFADQLSVRVLNSCEEKTVHVKDDQTIATTKPDKLRHGIGLSSVRKAVEKYGGSLSFHMLSDHQFLLNIMLPIRKTE